MSKIGRKPININGVQVEVKGQNVHYKGAKTSGTYTVPDQFLIALKDGLLSIIPHKEKAKDIKQREVNRDWGLHRALLANELMGSAKEFEKVIEIVGLGYKAVKTGDKLVFALGYSHKIDFLIPKGVSVSIDKTGQKLTLSASNKVILGEVCSKICGLRTPEPYKGTGVKLATEQIFRKESKGK